MEDEDVPARVRVLLDELPRFHGCLSPVLYDAVRVPAEQRAARVEHLEVLCAPALEAVDGGVGVVDDFCGGDARGGCGEAEDVRVGGVCEGGAVRVVGAHWVAPVGNGVVPTGIVVVCGRHGLWR